MCHLTKGTSINHLLMLLRAQVTLVDLRRIWNQCLPILPTGNPNNQASTRFITQKLAWVSLSEFSLNGRGSWREGQRVKNFIKNINKVKITLGSICLFYDQMNTLIIFTRHGSLIVEIVLSQFIEVFNYFQGVCFVWRFCFVFVCENQTTHDRNNSNSGLSLMEMLDFF